MKKWRMKFAKAVYCAGVDSWYVRLGPWQGIDVMYLEASKNQAVIHARLINATLNRELEGRYPK